MKTIPPVPNPWLSLLAGLFLLLASCGGGSGGARAPGFTTASMGPSGGVLIGPVGTELEGVRVVVPFGALDRFVSIRMVGGKGAPVEGNPSIGPELRFEVSPDPGRLNKALQIRVPVKMPRFRDPRDVVGLVQKLRSAGRPPLWIPSPPGRGLDQKRRFFETSAAFFGRVRVVLSKSPRRIGDSAGLVSKAVALFKRMDPPALNQALAALGQALQADPFNQDAHFYTALTLLAVLVNNEEDLGPGIDSLGEALDRLGVPRSPNPFFLRVFKGDWPGRLLPSARAPKASELLEFLRKRFLPRLDQIEDELEKVGDGFRSSFFLSGFLDQFGGVRELDEGDVLLLLGSIEALRGAVDLLESYDLDLDLKRVLDELRAGKGISQILALFPHVGRPRASRLKSAKAGILNAASLFRDAFVSIRKESDDQRDDLIAFRKGFGEKERDLFLADFDRWLGLFKDGKQGAIGRAPLQFFVAPSRFFEGVGLDLRSFVPEFDHRIPLGGSSLKDPSLGGLFPGMTQALATNLADLATKARLVKADILVDGRFSDWPASAEVLLPRDPNGDSTVFGYLSALDLGGLWLAISSRNFYVRIDLGDGDPRTHPKIAKIYQLRVRDLEAKQGKKLSFTLSVDLLGTRPKAVLRVQGQPEVPCAVALGKGGLEIGVPLLPLMNQAGVGRAPRRRVLRVRSRGFDPGSGRSGGDRTRPVLMVF
ncbi:MAG TPA: hypothetical protein ENK02_00680 [Planctomycetes bacterium]|nr:hypothetical protein [Planctomycetota bacterium]